MTDALEKNKRQAFNRWNKVFSDIDLGSVPPSTLTASAVCGRKLSLHNKLRAVNWRKRKKARDYYRLTRLHGFKVNFYSKGYLT